MFRTRSGYRHGEVATAGGAGRRRGDAALAASSGLLAVARLVRLIGTVVAAVIVAGILLVVLKANPSNEIVRVVHDAAKFLAGPFDGLFRLSGRRVELAVNWGLAAVVYFAISRIVARILARAAL